MHDKTNSLQYLGKADDLGVTLCLNPSTLPKWVSPLLFNLAVEVAAYNPTHMQVKRITKHSCFIHSNHSNDMFKRQLHSAGGMHFLFATGGLEMVSSSVGTEAF